MAKFVYKITCPSVANYRLLKSMELLAIKINGNRGIQQEILCFNKSFKRKCTISIAIPNFGV